LIADAAALLIAGDVLAARNVGSITNLGIKEKQP